MKDAILKHLHRKYVFDDSEIKPTIDMLISKGVPTVVFKTINA